MDASAIYFGVYNRSVMTDNSKVDWNSEHYRRIITGQRRWLYHRDWFENAMRELTGLGAGKKLRGLDVGCGAGYLAFELAKLDSKLQIAGADTNDELLESAIKESAELGLSDRIIFEKCSCYDMPYEDAEVDFAGAHTLLLHLTDPVRALKEMARVVKSGGTVFACEPDNFASFPSGFDCASEPDGTDYEWAARKFEYAIKLYRGKIAAGEGDSAVARRMPLLFRDAGLDVFFFRKSDRFLYLLPPYDTEEKVALADNLKVTLSEENCRRFFPTLREEFKAGGGTDTEFDGFWNERIERQNKALDALEDEKLTWVYNHTVAVCAGRVT